MKQTKSRQVVLAVLLVFSILAAVGMSLLPKDPHARIDFNEIDYVRPDLNALNREIDLALSDAKAGGKERETLDRYDDILGMIRNLETMNSVAQIRFDLNRMDEFYETENNTLDEAYDKLDNRMNELTEAVLAAYPDAAKKAWGQEFIDRYEHNKDLNSPEIEELSQQERDLVNEYNKLSVMEYTTTLDGRTVTISDLDTSTEEGVNAYYEIYLKRNQELGEIFRELIAVRNQIAEKLGFDSYTDYAYAALGRDYTKEDAAAFSQKVKEILVPINQQIAMQYGEQINSTLAGSEGVSVEDGVAYLQKALKEGYPKRMSEALDYMLTYHLYDFSADENKGHAGYTTIINDYDAPYMFINTSDYPEASTLFHEFGHYYNFYLMRPTSWNDSNSLDTAEIHSQSLELLMHESYPELYGDEAEARRIYSLYQILQSVLSGCAEDEFQQAVYENPEMTLEQMNLLHAQIYQEYLGYPIVFEWVEIHHHFETPFYYISYATSAISALELWEVSSADRNEALEIYDKITQHTINVDYLDALQDSGLSNPFTSDCVGQVGEALTRELGLATRGPQE